MDGHIPEALIDELVYAITYALQQEKIYTTNMILPDQPDYGLSAGFCRPPGWCAGPQTISLFFQLHEPTGQQRGKALSLGPSLAHYAAGALGLRTASDDFRVRVQDAPPFVVVTVPRPDPWIGRLEDLRRDAAASIKLGWDERGQPLHIDIVRQVVNGILLAGAPGSGKTMSLLATIIQALQLGWELALIDMKGGDDLAPLGPWAHRGAAFCEPVDDAAAAPVLDSLIATMTARNSGREPKTPPILLVVDEVADLSGENQQKLSLIARHGRSAMIRTMAATQRLGDEVLSGIKGSLPNRIVGQVSSSTDSYLAAGRKDVGAEYLLGRGDMLWVESGLKEIRFRAPLVWDKDGGERLEDVLARELGGVPKAEHRAPRPAERPAGREQERESGPLTLDNVMERLERLRLRDPRRTLPSAAAVRRVLIHCCRKRRPLTQAELHAISQETDGVLMSEWKRETMNALVGEILGLREPEILAGLRLEPDPNGKTDLGRAA